MRVPRHPLPALLLLCALASPAPPSSPGRAGVEVDWGPWYVLLPVELPKGTSGVTPTLPPEKELSRMAHGGPGPDLARSWRGKRDREIDWRLAREGAAPGNPDVGKVDFQSLVPEGYSESERKGLTDQASAFLYATIASDADVVVPCYLGSDDGCRVWLNGARIHEFDGPRGLGAKDDIVYLELKSGVNHLLVKVYNVGGAWSFQLTPEPEELTAGLTDHQRAVNAAINRGVAYLLKTQQRDGSWAYHAGTYRNGQTALSVYALLKSGLGHDHQAVRRGIEYLRLREPKKTYSVACQILALVSAHREEYGPWIQELADQLVDWQVGSFAYPTGQPDLSNTQYGALGLWAASRSGAEVPRRVWVDLARAVLAYRRGDGGFGYRPGNAPTGSMTVAGVTVISICADRFGEKGFPAQWRRELEQARADGLRWLGDNFSRNKNPRAGGAAAERWKHYYLYGLERLAAIEGLDEFGLHDWYWEGSTFLVGDQKEDGEWKTSQGEPEPNTAFALLFLNRATASITGQGSSIRKGRLYATDDEDSDIVLRAKGETPINLWVSEIRPAAVEAHAREGPKGRGVYVRGAEYLADGERVGMVEMPGDGPWAGEPLAMQHRFEERGEHTIQVRLHLVPDPADPQAEPGTIESPVLEVRVDELLEDWMFDYVDDSLSNIALGERKQISASSQESGGRAAGKALDGLQATAWVCKKDDADPRLTIEFRRPIRADRLVISHVAGTELARGQFDRATKVELDIGGKRDELVFDVDPDETKKTVLPLPRTSKLSRVTLRVLERIEGTKHPGCVGFAEVEFRNGEERPKRR